MVGGRETGEAVKGFSIPSLATKTAHGTNSWQSHVANKFAFQIKDFYLVVGIFHVRGDELMIQDPNSFQGFVGLGNNFFPVRPIELGNIDLNDPSFRCIKISAEPETIALIINKAVLCLKRADQLNYWIILTRQIFVENEIARVGTQPNGNNQITTIFCDATAKSPIFWSGRS